MDDGKHVSPAYGELDHALLMLKDVLDPKTGEWASRVVFRGNRPAR